MRSTLWRLGGWLLPYSLYIRLADRHRRRAEALRYEREYGAMQRLAAPNAALRGIHKAERCFILCNGPSVKTQNLLPLAGEIVISVSNGYLHPDYMKFSPRYHCIPQITYGRLTETDVVTWFREMHDHLGDAEMILSTTEESLVRRHGLFPGRKVHYVFLHNSLDEHPDGAIPDLATAIPRVESVPILCLMAAMYMGFDRLYLVGTDHDQFKSGTYTYFFQDWSLRGKDPDVTPEGKVLTPHFEEFQQLVRLWKQYRALRNIAEVNGIGIFNATAGGELDEFPRVNLPEVLADKEFRSVGRINGGRFD
jgi:hypothetical protein